MDPVELPTNADPVLPTALEGREPPFAPRTRDDRLPGRRRLSKIRVRGADWPKHVAILALLGVELLPLYMMIQTSVKDNAAFNANPWLPVGIGRWHLAENFSYGFHLIAPLVANTVFVAVLSTAGSVVLALCAAYFFARYKMPGSGFLWAAFLALMLMPSVANLVPLFSLLVSLKLIKHAVGPRHLGCCRAGRCSTSTCCATSSRRSARPVRGGGDRRGDPSPTIAQCGRSLERADFGHAGDPEFSGQLERLPDALHRAARPRVVHAGHGDWFISTASTSSPGARSWPPTCLPACH